MKNEITQTAKNPELKKLTKEERRALLEEKYRALEESKAERAVLAEEAKREAQQAAKQLAKKAARKKLIIVLSRFLAFLVGLAISWFLGKGSVEAVLESDFSYFSAIIPFLISFGMAIALFLFVLKIPKTDKTKRTVLQLLGFFSLGFTIGYLLGIFVTGMGLGTFLIFLVSIAVAIPCSVLFSILNQGRKNAKTTAWVTNQALANSGTSFAAQGKQNLAAAQAKADSNAVIKGAIVGGIIGGEAGAVVGAVAAKASNDAKNSAAQ